MVYTSVIQKIQGFLTDFMSSESSKNTHLNHSEVLVAYNALEASKANNQNLVIEIDDKKKEKGNLALRRCEFEESSPGWFENPKSKDELEVAWSWINIIEIISKLKDKLRDKEAVTCILQTECNNTAKEVTIKQGLMNSTNSEMKVLRKNIIRKITLSKNKTVHKEQKNLYHKATNDNSEVRSIAYMDTSLLMTQVGYINVSPISDDGIKVYVYLDLSPSVKFYSGCMYKRIPK